MIHFKGEQQPQPQPQPSSDDSLTGHEERGDKGSRSK